MAISIGASPASQLGDAGKITVGEEALLRG